MTTNLLFPRSDVEYSFSIPQKDGVKECSFRPIAIDNDNKLVLSNITSSCITRMTEARFKFLCKNHLKSTRFTSRMTPMPSSKNACYYAVFSGRISNIIVDNYKELSLLIKNFEYPKYRKFSILSDAEKYLDELLTKKIDYAQTPSLQSFPEKLTTIRQIYGHSQNYLAKAISRPVKVIKDYESGNVKLSIEDLIRLSDFFNMPSDFFIKDIDLLAPKETSNLSLSVHEEDMIRKLRALGPPQVKYIKSQIDALYDVENESIKK